VGVVGMIAVLWPRRIVCGGGVLQHAPLLPRVRRRVVDLLAGYVGAREILEDVDRFIIPPALGADAGVAGALALAQAALGRDRSEASAAE
jgi:fructokinase